MEADLQEIIQQREAGFENNFPLDVNYYPDPEIQQQLIDEQLEFERIEQEQFHFLQNEFYDLDPNELDIEVDNTFERYVGNPLARSAQRYKETKVREETYWNTHRDHVRYR